MTISIGVSGAARVVSALSTGVAAAARAVSTASVGVAAAARAYFTTAAAGTAWSIFVSGGGGGSMAAGTSSSPSQITQNHVASVSNPNGDGPPPYSYAWSLSFERQDPGMSVTINPTGSSAPATVTSTKPGTVVYDVVCTIQCGSGETKQGGSSNAVTAS